MKNSMAVLLLIGAISNPEQFSQVQGVSQQATGFLQAENEVKAATQEQQKQQVEANIKDAKNADTKIDATSNKSKAAN